MNQPLRVLILEDRDVDAELMVHELRHAGLSCSPTRVWTKVDFEHHLSADPPDIILADYTLPAYDGLSALRAAAREAPDTPFIFVSGSLGEEVAIDALHHGATDYVLKHRLSRLGPAVNRALREVEERRLRRESEDRFRSIFDNVTDGILLVDPGTGRFAMANLTVARMLACAREDVLALGTRDIHAEDDLQQIEQACRANATDTLVIHDLPITRRDGTQFYADVNTAPVVISGRPLIMMNVRDVTERRALQASVAQADRLASMGMLAAGVAHEINNPLSYVVYGLETLVEELPTLVADRPDADDLIRCAAESLAGTMRIKDIARGLSTFSRTAPDTRSQVDVAYAIECAAVMARNEIKYRARLQRELAPVPKVLASEGRLSQVFLNLLINAAHAIPEGHPDAHVITVRTALVDGMVVAEVSDTGAGIPRANLERVFEPFFTTKAAGTGTGLGLAISRNIVRDFGGDIGVSSTPGTGATFTVRLPAAPSIADTSTQPVGPATARLETLPPGRILVVDDEPAVRRMLARQFEGSCCVVTAASGAEAKQAIESQPPFDAVVCDVIMPDMTGTELHGWVATAHPALAQRFVFLTGGAFTPRAAEYLTTVPNPRFEKPVEATALRTALSRIMVHKEPAGSMVSGDR